MHAIFFIVTRNIIYHCRRETGGPGSNDAVWMDFRRSTSTEPTAAHCGATIGSAFRWSTPR